MTRFLDGVAKADLLRLDAQRQHLLQLIDGGDVEVRALVAQQREHFVGGVGFYGVVNLGERKAVDQLVVGTVNGFQINDQEGGFTLVSGGLQTAEGVTIEVVVKFDGHGVGSKALSSGDGPRGDEKRIRYAGQRCTRTPRSIEQALAVRLPTEATLNAFSQHTTRGCERLISIPTLVRLLPKACAESNKPALFRGLAVSSSVLEPYGSCQPQRSERTLKPSDPAVNSRRPFIWDNAIARMLPGTFCSR